MSLPATIIAIILLIISEVYFSTRRPIWSYAGFMFRLVAMVTLMLLVWYPGPNGPGSMNSKILLTSVAFISLIQSFRGYRRGLKKQTI